MPYLNPHQTRDAEPTDYENLLADAIEAAFGRGIVDLQALVASLNDAAVPAPGGKLWTAEVFQNEMARLGR
jgi:hypothetical protein